MKKACTICRLARLLWLVSIVTLLTSCSPTGTLVYESVEPGIDGHPPSRSRLSLRTPSSAVAPGTIHIGKDGTLSASTGNGQATSAASRSLGKLTWLGGILLVAGIVAFAIRAKLKFLPLELGLGLTVSGLLLMILPSAIEAYLPHILIGLIATAVITTVWRLNKFSFRLRQMDPKDPTPDA